MLADAQLHVSATYVGDGGGQGGGGGGGTVGTVLSTYLGGIGEIVPTFPDANGGVSFKALY